MNEVAFDFEALLRGIIIGLGTGLIVAVIVHAISRLRWGIVILLAIGVALILTTISFYAWPSLVEVPNLANRSHAEAELLLAKKALISEARPQHTTTTEAGRVVPYSQDPLPGIKVCKGTVVRFSVSESPRQLSRKTKETEVIPSVSLFRPRSGEKVYCRRYENDGAYRFSAEGMSEGVVEGGLQLLLWARPVSPPSEIAGWYLQRPPINGIASVEPDGSWRGIGQIGNAQWPPHEGDILDVAITVVDAETAQHLLGAPGIVTRIDLLGITSDKALEIKVGLK